MPLAQIAESFFKPAVRDIVPYEPGKPVEEVQRELGLELAERHGVELEEIALGAGADGVVDCLSQVSLDPGDEIVCGWPSFPSYVIGARKLGAEPKQVPLQEGRYDLDAILGAVTQRTKLVYVCPPNNPTGTINTR